MIIETIIVCITFYASVHLVMDVWDDEKRRQHDRREAEREENE